MMVSWVEFYLRHPDRLEELDDERKEYFWSQRKWHPVIRMNWNAMIQSNGEGLITYPNGRKQVYTAPTD